MALTRSFRETVVKRVQTDPAFRAALVEEAVQNMIDGDMQTARSQFRDVINATMGFEALSAAMGVSKPSLMRMLGPTGNPRADNLAEILRVLGSAIGVRILARVEALEQI